MPTNVTKAKKDLPKLREFANQLTLIVNEMLQQAIPYKETDHLAFMSLCFVSKQIEHLKSICLLIDAGQHKDAALIARSMIEGMYLLLWAAQESTTRPLLWRSYAYVEDFRLMNKKEQMGEEIVSAEKTALLGQLKKYGPRFYTKEAQKAHSDNLPLPDDPYRKTWSGKTVADISKDVKGQLLYREIYKEISAWIHWSPRGIGTSIRRGNQEVLYIHDAVDMAAMSLASGFQSVLETASLLDAHLTLGFVDRLTTLRDTYIDELLIPQPRNSQD